MVNRTFVLLVTLAAILSLSWGQDTTGKLRADAKVKTSARVNFTDNTIKVKCSVDKVPNPEAAIPVLVQLRRVSDDAVPVIALQKGAETKVLSDVNGTTATGSMDSKDGTLEAIIPLVKDTTTDEKATFQCIYVYFKLDTFEIVFVNSNATVSLVEPTELTSPLLTDDCSCEQVREEVNALKETLIEENRDLKRQLQSYDDKCRVSFTATLSEPRLTAFRSNFPLVFDNVLSNKGEAYNSATGSFTAPCRGQYFFRLSLRTHQEFSAGFVDGVIEVDGTEVARTSVFTADRMDHYEQASNGLVMTLKEGSKVMVRTHTDSEGRIFGEGYSLFSGFFLSP